MRSTEILLLGTAHLDAATSDEQLERGVCRLLRWRPDAVAVETLPGHLVLEYEQRGGVFADFPVGWAPAARRGAEVAGRSLDIDVWRARRIARSAAVSTRERILAWLISREPLNALLLPWHDEYLPSAVQEFLDSLESSPSERVRIGLRIAQELGHDEVISIDDHAGLAILEDLPGDWHDVVAPSAERNDPTDGPSEPADAWDTWVETATEGFRSWSEELESTYLLDIDDSRGIARARFAQWRTRNLAMASRIREATARIPGGRLLVVVGSAHERPLRAALAVDQHDIHVTDIATLEG